MKRPHRLDTLLVHAGEPSPRIEGAVSIPIFQTAMYEMGAAEDYHAIRYIRLNNTPNHLAVQQKLAALEGAESALVTASGMAAISASLLATLRQGDHVLLHNTLYGGTHSFATQDLPALGIEIDSIDADRPETWERALKPNTKAVYVETMTNPLLEVCDLEGIVTFAKSKSLISMIDNTFASPINYRPIERGFDLSIHSGTKYLNGHSDIVAGAVVGSRELVTKVRHKLNHLGGTMDPHACFLLHRGLKTLGLRIRQQNQSALAIARALEEHRAVARVNYPGLESHSRHERAKSLFDGFGGMLSFELQGGLDAAVRFIERARIPLSAPSLGGVESLLTRPAVSSHAGMTPEERAEANITDSLIRMSVGIESTEDLIEDLQQALA